MLTLKGASKKQLQEIDEEIFACLCPVCIGHAQAGGEARVRKNGSF